MSQALPQPSALLQGPTCPPMLPFSLLSLTSPGEASFWPPKGVRMAISFLHCQVPQTPPHGLRTFLLEVESGYRISGRPGQMQTPWWMPTQISFLQRVHTVGTEDLFGHLDQRIKSERQKPFSHVWTPCHFSSSFFCISAPWLPSQWLSLYGNSLQPFLYQFGGR